MPSCPQCEVLVESPSKIWSITDHVKSGNLTESKVGLYSCKKCNKQLKSKGSMENHITKMHMPVQSLNANDQVSPEIKEAGHIEEKSYNLGDIFWLSRKREKRKKPKLIQ